MQTALLITLFYACGRKHRPVPKMQICMWSSGWLSTKHDKRVARSFRHRRKLLVSELSNTEYYTALRDAAKYSCSTRWHIQDGTYGTDPIGSHTGTCSKLLPGLTETASRGSHCSFRTSCWRSQHLWRQLSSMSVRPGRSRHR